ncbi:MAG TPA: ubiquitin-like small modifier protein 1 [Methanocella sp.]|uniref:ubiquitin-like small modifier protein 1 n=1 Tax=Methanocella sp. TaxID=2052833 RepID=UPI002CDF3B3F|nr:ubiquitin-like small modifier protein 1 [Methanocella sp.]HTY90921.1 ubiquitin-like small modifier protein 1 [Methanocella sp.]
MKLKVKLFANFREVTKNKEVEISPKGDKVNDIISALIHDYPKLEPLMLNGAGVKPYVNILINGKSVLDQGGLQAPIKEGDEVTVFPPVSGG